MSNDNFFTIQYTNMIKGVALLLLLCNHFCVVKDWITKSINLGIVGVYTDIVITPFVVYAFFVFFQYANNIVKRLFVYIGKASMVVWLVHWVFNVGVYEIQRMAYFPKVSYFVILWVLVMCLGFNVVFSYLINKSHILIKINKKQ